MQYSLKTIIQPRFQGSFLLSPLSYPLRRRWGRRVLSLLSECKVRSFHILRSSPCPCQCFTHLKVTCCHFIKSLACGEQTLFSVLVSPAKKIAGKTSASRRLSSLMLLFQGHVACGNFYPNRVLIPTHPSLAL